MRVQAHSLRRRFAILAAGVAVVALVGPAAAQVQQRNPFTNLQNQINEQAAEIIKLQQQNAALQQLLACISPSSTSTDIYFSGCNVHIVSGAGATDAPVNGVGNLIVGYNEPRSDGSDMRNGSHNIVVGKNNNYTSYGGFVAGAGNGVNGAFTSVSGGKESQANGDFSSVSGGSKNTASGLFASVSGGAANSASGSGSSVSGGIGNQANGGSSSIGGGVNNTTSGDLSSVSGGDGVDAVSDDSWAAGSPSNGNPVSGGTFSSP